MLIKILFDKAADDKKFCVGWGVSVFIDNHILFDTGENGPWLIKNLKNSGGDIHSVDKVVISHDHWDHTGGLWDVLALKPKLPVYACPGFGAKFKNMVQKCRGELRLKDEMIEISENIFITGEIPGEYKGRYMPEQAAVLKTEKGITVITGCSHPGIVKIAEKVKKSFAGDNLNLVLGGFHLPDTDVRVIEAIAKKLINTGFSRAAPTHCSGPEAEEIFSKIFNKNFIAVKVGQTIEV